MSTPEYLALPLRCRSCNRPVTVRFVNPAPGEVCDEAVWRCPSCGTEHPLGVVGRVAWVMKSTAPGEREPGG